MNLSIVINHHKRWWFLNQPVKNGDQRLSGIVYIFIYIYTYLYAYIYVHFVIHNHMYYRMLKPSNSGRIIITILHIYICIDIDTCLYIYIYMHTYANVHDTITIDIAYECFSFIAYVHVNMTCIHIYIYTHICVCNDTYTYMLDTWFATMLKQIMLHKSRDWSRCAGGNRLENSTLFGTTWTCRFQVSLIVWISI